MKILLADAINFPLVIGFGLVVLIPLMLFETTVEAFVLSKIWKQSFRDLCRFTFSANVWSLAAGIPTKILNAFIYSYLLPSDIPGFFARYPFAVTTGTLIYFVVTILVETCYAFRWLRLKQLVLTRREIWLGVCLANIASYAVLAPLHYYVTRPTNGLSFVKNPKESHFQNQIIFTDASDYHLKAVRLNGTFPETVVPFPARDYLLSSNLNNCLFRGTNGNLYFYRRDGGQPNLLWKTEERFGMNQVAFSPSAKFAAFVSEKGNYIEVIDLRDGKHIQQKLSTSAAWPDFSLAWSQDDLKFFAKLDNKNFIGSISDNQLSLEPLINTNSLTFLSTYGRAATGRWWGGEDWGVSYGHDSCGGLTAWTEPGLGSGLRIYRESRNDPPVVSVAVNPGLLHIAAFYFSDVAFLDGCDECLFQANDYIYILNIKEKTLSIVARGERFILLSPRYEKHL